MGFQQDKGSREFVSIRWPAKWSRAVGRSKSLNFNILVSTILFFTIILIVLGGRGYAQPPRTPEEKRAKEVRLTPAEATATALGRIKEPKSPTRNFKGQTDAGKTLQYLVDDTIAEVLNVFQCMDWRFLDPRCYCGKTFFGAGPFPLAPAYEYRFPMTRYEVSRQPFQSEFWPQPVMNVLQAVTVKLAKDTPAFALLINLDISRVFLALLNNGLKVPTPKNLLDFFRGVIKSVFSNIPDEANNAGRGGGFQSDGTFYASVHAIPSLLRFGPMSKPFEPVAVQSHYSDGFRVESDIPVGSYPAWTESPEINPLARSPGRSGMLNQRELVDMWTKMLTDVKACARFNQQQWSKYFRPDGPTVGMPPDASIGGDGPVDPKKDPCLRFGNLRWFPFDFHINASSETVTAWVAVIKMAKLLSHTRGETEGVRNWPDLYDLEDDRFQYLRGNGLDESKFKCANIEMAFEEFGDANTLDHDDTPITVTHWKRYSGCPKGLVLVNSPFGGVCPSKIEEKIEKQSIFNPEVNNSSRKP